MTGLDRVVITIHGIRTDGEWQDKAAKVLAPYYKCEGFNYKEYRHSVMAVVWLALELIGAVAGLCVVVWALVERKSLTDLIETIAILFGILLWTTARYFARARRERVLSRLREFFSEKRGPGLPPHVIAHSLGTLLIGMLLEKYLDVHIGTLILNGCVLNRGFLWRKLEQRCGYVRNEMACKDSVSMLASLLHTFIPSMGSAGAFGFRGSREVAAPHEPHESKCCCPRGCSTGLAERPAWVDNVRHELFLHSDYHIGEDHQSHFWIPVLWGFNPLPFAEFLNKCRKGMELLPSKENLPEGEPPEVYSTPALDELEEELKASCWGWANGTLNSYLLREWVYALRQRGFDRAALIQDLTTTSLRMLWIRIGKDLLEGKPIRNPEATFVEIQIGLLDLLKRKLADGNIRT